MLIKYGAPVIRRCAVKARGRPPVGSAQHPPKRQPGPVHNMGRRIPQALRRPAKKLYAWGPLGWPGWGGWGGWGGWTGWTGWGGSWPAMGGVYCPGWP